MKTIKPNIAEIKRTNNDYNLRKLQRQNIKKSDLGNIQFHTIKYKNIIEILIQKNQTNEQKVEELLDIDVTYNWLDAINIFTKWKSDFLFDNSNDLLDIDSKLDKWESVNYNEYPVLNKNIDKYNEEVENNLEEYYKLILHVFKQRHLWNYEKIVQL